MTVKTDGGLQDLLGQNENYYAPFDIVIACDLDILSLSMINTVARFANRPFYAAGIHGFYVYIFADLVLHEFVVEREKSNRDTVAGPESMTRSVVSVTTKKESKGGTAEKTMEIVKKQELYCPFILANTSPLPVDVMASRRKLKTVPALLPCLRALFDFQRTYGHYPVTSNQQHLTAFSTLVNDKVRELQLPPETMRGFMKSFVPNIGTEIVPTAAFVGGRLSEDVINVLGKREQPIQNFALFDGESLEGRIYSLYSPPPEATMPMGMDMGMGMGGTIDGMNGGLGMDMGMGMGMEMGLQMGMPVGGDMMGVGMPGMGMMMDGTGTGMMDANGMMMSNGMSNGGMPDMTSGVDMGVDTGAATAPVNEIGAGTAEEAAAPNQTVAQDPPRSVPVDEAETSGT